MIIKKHDKDFDNLVFVHSENIEETNNLNEFRKLIYSKCQTILENNTEIRSI